MDKSIRREIVRELILISGKLGFSEDRVYDLVREAKNREFKTVTETKFEDEIGEVSVIAAGKQRFYVSGEGFNLNIPIKDIKEYVDVTISENIFKLVELRI